MGIYHRSSWTLKTHWHPKTNISYYHPRQKRIIVFSPDDMFTRQEDGTYTKQTGICLFGLALPEDEMELVEGPVELVMI